MANARSNALLNDLDSRPLSEALPHILRVAQEIGDSGFEKWIRLELNGYWRNNSAMSENAEVPDYRMVVGQWKDDFGNVLVLPDELSYLNEFPLRNALVELEAFQQSKGELGLRHPGSTSILKGELRVDVSTFWFRPSAVRAVLSAIRIEASDRLMERRSALNRLPGGANADEPNIIELRPNFYGIGLNLRALWKRLRKSG